MGVRTTRTYRTVDYSSAACSVALKVWMSVQTFGMAAFREAVAQGMEFAAQAEKHVRESPGTGTPEPIITWSRVLPNQLCGTGSGRKVLEEVNRTVLARVFWDDPAFITSTLLNGKFSLRLCILNHTTTWNDVQETLESIEKSGTDALASHGR